MTFPEQFGRYRLISHLATGGMGKVYLALMDGPSGFQRECVIKRMLKINGEGEEARALFINEAKIMGLIHHPNVVQVIDFGTMGDEVYLALEFVDGPTLYALMRAAWRHDIELGPSVAAAVGMRLAEGLDFAHNLSGPDGTALGIVHRDISPGNVLLSMRGQVKLTDFGVAKLSTGPQTTAGVIKGKFAYMSPEQASAEPVDRRSDLFSLGVVLYEVAVGRHLFRQNDAMAELVAVLRGAIPKPSELVPKFPPELEAIIMRLLNRDREQRYANAAEVRRELEAVFRILEPTATAEEIISEAIQELKVVGADLRLASQPVSGPLSGPMAAAAAAAAGTGGRTPSFTPDMREPPVVIMRAPTGANRRVPASAALIAGGIVVLSATFWLWLLLSHS